MAKRAMWAWVAVGVVAVLRPSQAAAIERFVGPGETFTTIQAALDAAVDGDIVTVRAGTYTEALRSRAPGVTLRRDPAGGDVIVTQTDGTVLTVDHARFTAEGLILDGQYGQRDGIIVDDGANMFTLRNSEVRRVAHDCIDIRAPSDVLIEGSTIHHCLWSTSPGCAADACRMDAHGIVAGPVQRLTIRDTEIHTFSGDAFQVDPGRSAPGWNNVTIERCHMWLEPLPAAEGGYAAGVVPGENAVDTKVMSAAPRAVLVLRDIVAHGFGGALIGNAAAFNLKENVQALVERVTVYGSEIAFRLRGATSSSTMGAQVTLRNVVVYDVTGAAVRYEDDIVPVRMENVTFGDGIPRAFQNASAPSGVIDAHNFLVLAGSLPADGAGASNLAVSASAFVASATDDYHLAAGSPAIDTGEMLAMVTVDRDGTMRPIAAGWDIGAYEACMGAACAPVDAGVPAGTDAGPPSDAGPPRDAGGVAPGSDGGPGGMRDGGGAGGADGGGTGSTPDDGGCGCRVAASGRTAPWVTAAALALVVTLVVRRRRGRRR